MTTGNSSETIKENFFPHFNKAAPSEENLPRNWKTRTSRQAPYWMKNIPGDLNNIAGNDVKNRLNETMARLPMKSTRKRSAQMQIQDLRYALA